MARPLDLAKLPDPNHVLRELRALAPQCEYPVHGAEAICDWLQRHGIHKRNGERLPWRRVLELEKRCGEKLHANAPAIGIHQGRPWTTHLLLLRWCLANLPKLGPPGHPDWRPSPRALASRAQRKRDSAGQGTGPSSRGDSGSR